MVGTPSIQLLDRQLDIIWEMAMLHCGGGAERGSDVCWEGGQEGSRKGKHARWVLARWRKYALQSSY